MTPSLDRDRRQEVQALVVRTGEGIASGRLWPEIWVLDLLIVICDALDLPIEAARVRRWLGSGGRTEAAPS